MKSRFTSIWVGLTLGLLTSHGYGMSSLSFLSIEPEWPGTTQPGNVVLYKVTAVCREGQGLLEVLFDCLGLPEGAAVTSSPAPLRFTGNNPTLLTAIISIDCAALTTTDLLPFMLTATAQRESMTITNRVTPPLYAYPSGPPLLAIDLLSGAALKLRGTGAVGETYTIETCTDLANPDWTQMGTTTADGNGRFSFFPSRDEQMRFYRAVWTGEVNG